MRGKCCVEARVFILSIYAEYVLACLFSIALGKYIWHTALLKKLCQKLLINPSVASFLKT